MELSNSASYTEDETHLRMLTSENFLVNIGTEYLYSIMALFPNSSWFININHEADVLQKDTKTAAGLHSPRVAGFWRALPCHPHEWNERI